MKNLCLTLILALLFSEIYTQTTTPSQRLDASTIAQNSVYGRAVHINGDYAIIGANLDNLQGAITGAGAAYVYHLENGSWNFQYKLIAADAQANDHFGRSVYINSTHAIVSATYSDDPYSYTGSVYIFRNNNDGTWTQQARLLASDRRRMDRFGISVAIEGNYAVIGNAGADFTLDGVSYLNAGQIHIFEFNGTSWGNEVILRSDIPKVNETFGVAVDINNSTVIVGTNEIDGTDTDGVPASVYIFKRINGSWQQTQRITPTDLTDGEGFGYSVHLSDNYAIMGATNDNDHGTASGSAYIYRNDGGTYIFEQKLLAANGAPFDNLGNSVGIDGNQAVVGAYFTDRGTSNTGSAYLFRKAGSAWEQVTEFVANDPGFDDQNATFVSISGNYVFTGAPNWDTDRSNLTTDRGTNEGTAYVFPVSSQENPLLISTSPIHNASQISLINQISLTFNKAVQFASNQAQIELIRLRDNTMISQYAVNGEVSDSNLTISGNSLFINNIILENGTQYAVRFSGNPITDDTGNPFTGLTQIGEFNFSTIYSTPLWNSGFPNLSTQTNTSIQLNGNASIIGDNLTGQYYYVLTTSSVPPTELQILSGQDNSGNIAISSASGNLSSNILFTGTVNLSLLNSETSYYIHLLVQNSAQINSDIHTLSFTTFDTQSPAYIQPYPTITNISGHEATLNIQVNEEALCYIVIQQSNQAGLTIAQIIAQQYNAVFSDSVMLNSNSLSQLRITGLNYGTEYSAYIVTRDMQNNYVEISLPTILTFTTNTFNNSAPIATITPANGAVNVPTNQPITIVFDKTIYDLTGAIINNSNASGLIRFIQFNNSFNPLLSSEPPLPPTSEVQFTVSWDSSVTTLTIVPAEILAENKDYEISIDQVQDENGNVAEAKSSRFRTYDISAPVTIFFNPVAGSSNHNITNPLTVAFNEPVRTLMNQPINSNDLIGLISLYNLNNQQINVSASIDSFAQLIIIKPSTRLTPGTSYRLEINPVADVSGHAQTISASMTFLTASANIWTGQGNPQNFIDNNNWSSPFNSNSGVIIPGNTPTALINEDITVEFLVIESLGNLQNNAILTVRNDFIIESSENGNGGFINNGQLSVDNSKILIEQVLTEPQTWHLISSPIEEANGNMIMDEISNGDIYGFNCFNGAYYELGMNETLSSMEGYQISGTGKINFNGKLNSGAQNLSVVYGFYNDGWNLAGNPFTASIDWDLIAANDKSDIENSFWLWLNSGQFGTYNGNTHLSTNLGENESQIPSNHAFWIKAINTGGFSIDESCLTGNSTTYFKASEVSYPFIRMSGIHDDLIDEAVIAFAADASNDLDVFDSKKRFGQNPSAIELFTYTGNSELTINALKTFSSDLSINLGYKVQQSGIYKIEFTESSLPVNDYTLILEDTELNSFTELSIGESYIFESSDTISESRFIIHIKSEFTSLADLSENPIIDVYSYDKVITMEPGQNENLSFAIYDIEGQIIAADELTVNESRKITVDKAGIYFVRISGDGIQNSWKLLLK